MVQSKEHTAGNVAFHIVNYTLFGLFTLLCVFPFYYILICTISANNLVDLGKITLWPQGIHLNNYISIFRVNRIANAAGISLARTVIGTALTLLCGSWMAYLFTQEKLWKRKLWYRFTVATMYFSAGLIPAYVNMKMLSLTNTFWVYILPSMVSVYNMILTKTYIESLPASLEESAAIDGASYGRRFLQIVLPLSTPILATVALFTAVSQWNAYMDTKLYVSNYRLYTMQYQLYEYLNQANALQSMMETGMDMDAVDVATKLSTNSVRLTMTVVTVLPIMCVYPFIQRFYVKGLMVGAVKG